MERHGFAMEIKKGQTLKFRSALGEIWKDLTAFLDEISEFKKISATSTVSALINKILVKTGYENTVYLYNNGGNCYNNLLLFKATASDFEENVQRGLSAFVAYIKRQIKKSLYEMLSKHFNKIIESRNE